MRQSSSLGMIMIAAVLGIFLVCAAWADVGGSVADSSNWDVTSYQVKLVDHRGGSGDIQTDQNGWIYLGANHLEGGDIKYSVDVGRLAQEDIIEVWIDGYSTSTELDVGPTVFIGTGKNRYEQITRMTGDAWRPFVFRFADDALYGDVTDPSNRNASWRARYPSSKYEIRRIDKAPYTMLDGTTLPVRISMTGADDFILKRLEVVVYRSKAGYMGGEGVYMVKVHPASVREGDRVTVTLSSPVPTDAVEFYLIDPAGREYKVATQSLSGHAETVVFYADDYYFPRTGEYQLKLVEFTDPAQQHVDIERLSYQGRKVVSIPKAEPTPPISIPEIECGPGMVGSGCLPPVPVMPGSPYDMPGPYIAPVPAPYEPVPYGTPPYGVVPGQSPAIIAPQSQPYAQGYTIQVGAFTSRSSAERLKAKLQSRGFDAYLTESSKNGKPLFRVRVGRFLQKSAASQEVQRLRHSGFNDTWITDLT